MSGNVRFGSHVVVDVAAWDEHDTKGRGAQVHHEEVKPMIAYVVVDFNHARIAWVLDVDGVEVCVPKQFVHSLGCM